MRDYSGFANNILYKTYLQKVSQISFPINYNYFTYKDYIVPVGSQSCDTWETFTANGLNLPFADVEIAGIHLDQGIVSISNGSPSYSQISCLEKDKVDFIVSKILLGSQFLASCDGRMWRQFGCSGKNLICVDCEKNCDMCPGEKFVVRPCSGKNCNTNTASYSILSFTVKKKILYPLFLAPVVIANITRESVLIHLNISKPGIVICYPLEAKYELHSISTLVSNGEYRVNITIIMIIL